MKHRAGSMQKNSHTRTPPLTDLRSQRQEKRFNVFPGDVGSIRSGFDFLQGPTVFFVHAIKTVALGDTTSTLFAIDLDAENITQQLRSQQLDLRHLRSGSLSRSAMP